MNKWQKRNRKNLNTTQKWLSCSGTKHKMQCGNNRKEFPVLFFPREEISIIKKGPTRWNGSKERGRVKIELVTSFHTIKYGNEMDVCVGVGRWWWKHETIINWMSWQMMGYVMKMITIAIIYDYIDIEWANWFTISIEWGSNWDELSNRILSSLSWVGLIWGSQ